MTQDLLSHLLPLWDVIKILVSGWLLAHLARDHIQSRYDHKPNPQINDEL